MDITAILKELYRERELLDQAIVTLERAQVSTYRRRGRPPKWLERARSEKQDSPAASTTTSRSVTQSVSKRKSARRARQGGVSSGASNGGNGLLEKSSQASGLVS